MEGRAVAGTMTDAADTMRAVGFSEHGPIDNLELLTVSVPEIGADEVLIEVRAAALNHQDLFAVRELDQYVPSYPFWGGGDMAGVVDVVGAGVDGWAVGDRVVVDPTVTCGRCRYCRRGEQSMCVDYAVFGEHRHGGFAEYAAVPARNLHAVPAGVDWTVAAAAPMATGTAWRALLTRAAVEPFESLLIVGATGGVGHMAVQIADRVANVAELYTTTGSEAKEGFLRELGVDHVIDYTAEAFEQRVWELTDGSGVDVVYNNVGGETWVPSMRALANGGRLITSGATAGPNPATELRLIFVRQLDVLGSTAHAGDDLDRALAAVWDGTVTPYVQATFPLEEYAEAFGLMADRALTGKVVFEVS